jgi:hypothetical protein
MQATALDRDDYQTDTTHHNSTPDDGGDQDNFDLWLDLGGSD